MKSLVLLLLTAQISFGAMVFDGVDDVALGAKNIHTNQFGKFTVFFRLFIHVDWQAFSMIASKVDLGTGATTKGWRILRQNAQHNLVMETYFDVATKGGNTTVDNYFTSNVWLNCIFMYDGSQTQPTNRIKIYVNGTNCLTTMTDTIPGAFTDDTGVGLQIGAHTNGATKLTFSGLISDFFILNNAVEDPERIWRTFNLGRRFRSIPTILPGTLATANASCLVYYSMLEGPNGKNMNGTPMRDWSSRSLHGTYDDGANNTGMSSVSTRITIP